MRHMFLHILLAMLLALGASACGHKGKLKSPTEAAKDIERKEKKKAKREQAAAQESEEAQEKREVDPVQLQSDSQD